MPKALRWSTIAIAEYQDAIQYVLEEWGESIALKFRAHTSRQLERIIDNPDQFQVVSKKQRSQMRRK